MRKIVIAATVAAPLFANAWGLGDALNKVNDATRGGFGVRPECR